MAGSVFCAKGRAVKTALCLCAAMLFAAAQPVLAKAAAPGNAAMDARIGAAVERIQSDDSYQLEFPPPPTPPQVPDWLRGFFDWLSSAGQWFVYTIAGLLILSAVLFILYLTVPSVRDAVDRLRARFRRKADDGADAGDWAPDHAAARNLLAEADALARDGRFAEAVHLLMGRSVEDIARRRPGVLKPALTARCIALLDDLPPPARAAFGRIAAAVERGLWARQVIAAPEWDDARTAYEDFAFGAHWRGHATGVAA